MGSRRASVYRTELETMERNAKGTHPLLSAVLFERAHFILPLNDEMTRLLSVLDPGKTLIGPNVLVSSAGPLVKGPSTIPALDYHCAYPVIGVTHLTFPAVRVWQRTKRRAHLTPCTMDA